MWKFFESLLRQAQIGQSRSSVINPLQWALVIGLFALLTAVLEPHVPTWLPIFLAFVVGIIVVLLICAYIFFMLKDPDSLRSEKYSLMKTAIEKHFIGDDLTGLREVIRTIDGVETKLLDSRDAGNIEQHR